MFFGWRKFLIIFLIAIVFVAGAFVFMNHDGGVLCPASLSQATGCIGGGVASLGLHHLSAARDMSEVPFSFLFYGLWLIFAFLFFLDRFKTAKISLSAEFPVGRAECYESGLLCLTRFWRWLAVVCRLLPERPNLWSARPTSPVF